MNQETADKPQQQYNRVPKATAGKQGAQWSLSWYSSVPEAGTHLTLSRQTAPKSMGRGWFSSRTRVWIASWRNTTGPGLRQKNSARYEVVVNGCHQENVLIKAALLSRKEFHKVVYSSEKRYVSKSTCAKWISKSFLVIPSLP